MAKQEQGSLSGFRDMLAEQMIPRQRMIDKIRSVYESYGFTPLDTPAIERQETLTGKYGAEGEKLMYKFTDNGGRLIALRYDLTVPLARVVAQHRAEISLPYKRYQVGNVWRGESPQAGRYREFMQFDADTVGTTSVIADAEIVSMMSDTMEALGADAVVRVNNRRILDALCEKAGVTTTESDTRKLVGIIDKVEKIGIEAALEEVEGNFDKNTALLVKSYLEVKGNDFERLTQIKELLGDSAAAKEGIANLVEVFTILSASGYTDSAVFDQTIARGLDYYTGIIYETTLKDLPKIGSVCSGGRYDKLVKALGGPDLPAVGASVGVDRLFAALQQLGKVEPAKTTSQVLIANFEVTDAPAYMKVANQLRKSGIATEVYYDQDKLGKQIKFANKMGIPYMLFIGSEEIEKGLITVKELSTGEQKQISIDELGSFFS